MRGGWALGSIAGLLGAWACGADAFTCSDDAQCQGGPSGGTCVEGYCAFPSEVCSSGLQYGDHAGAASGTCVPVGGSDTDPPDPSESSGGPPATTGPSTTSLDDAPLDTSGSGSEGPPAGEVEFRDDELRGEFGAGTMAGVEWAGDRLTLVANMPQGTFVSRVFDAGEPVTWQTVQWEPDGPYGKPLPDGGVAEVGYLEGGVDMAGNVLLMHFEGGGEAEWGSGTEVLDASGAESHGQVVTQGGALPLVSGVFGTAIDDQWETRISIPTQDASALEFGEDDFTWSLWARMNATCGTNNVYMGVDDTDAGVDPYPHLWLGCTTDVWEDCPAATDAPRAAGTMRSVHDDASDGGSFCGSDPIDGDVWHHLAVVKQGHENSTLRLFVDGALVFTTPAGFAGSMIYPNQPDFSIGAFSRGTYPAVVVLDEVAIWRRALGEDEVAAVFRRGVTSLTVAVRVCSEADCADDPPWGPTLVDPPQANGPGGQLPLEGLPVGRYVQYGLELHGELPALRAVVVRGMR